MSKPTPFRAPRPYSPDAIDTEPMQGRGRNEFEDRLFARVKRSHQLVLRIILDHAAGKADCWPGNKRVAEIAGYQVRNVQIILRALEKAQVIKCVPDRSLTTQRRIVILDHPHAVKVLARLDSLPWMQPGAQKPAPVPPPKQPQTVGAGAQSPAHAGAQTRVGAGAQRRATEFVLSPNPKASTPGGVSRSEGIRKMTQAELIAMIEADKIVRIAQVASKDT